MNPSEGTALSAPPYRSHDMRVAGVSRAYKADTGRVLAVNDVSASFRSGELTAISGPSGSGKTSLLRVLGLLDRADAGQLWIAGEDITRLNATARRALRRSTIGHVFQAPASNLLSYLTCYEHVRLGARLRGSPWTTTDDGLLDLLGLAKRASHRAPQLSGGEQQRVALAFAAAGRPSILVADEPTAALDSSAGKLVINALHILARMGLVVIASSHDPALVNSAHEVVFLDHGRRVS